MKDKDYWKGYIWIILPFLMFIFAFFTNSKVGIFIMGFAMFLEALMGWHYFNKAIKELNG